jgi:predicted transcriptional regulator
MEKSKYRSTNLIIQTILEGVLRGDITSPMLKKGVIKSHLVKYSGLKTNLAEKYLQKMEKAEYIKTHTEPWGERIIIIYEITPKGRERYEWFIKINTELEDDT